MLVERFEQVTAYWLLAGGPAAVGLAAAMFVSVKEQEEAEAEQLAEEAGTGEVVSDAAAQAIVQAPIALLGPLLTTPGGATSVLSVARLLGRNFPLHGVCYRWPIRPHRRDDETLICLTSFCDDPHLAG
jgi:hypothetical protein